MARLSDTALRAMAARPQEQRIIVDKNLYLRIRPSGSKVWCVRQMQQGKRSFVSIGTFPNMLLAAAKKKAATMVGGGVNAVLDVAFAVELYQERHITQLRPASQRSITTYLDALVSLYGARKLAALRRADFAAVIESYRRRGKLPASNRCASALHAFLAFAVNQGWLEINPMDGMRGRSKETARTRTLTEAEIRWLWNESPENHRRLFRALMLTGCRIGELCASTSDMVKGEMLILPAEITKTNRAHTVPLTKMALAALGTRGGDNDLIFPFNQKSVQAALVREKVGWRPHDIRRSFYTILSRLSVAPHVIERLVNHAPPKLVGVYNQHDYLPEMRAALERLSEWLGSMLADDGAPAEA